MIQVHQGKEGKGGKGEKGGKGGEKAHCNYWIICSTHFLIISPINNDSQVTLKLEILDLSNIQSDQVDCCDAAFNLYRN